MHFLLQEDDRQSSIDQPAKSEFGEKWKPKTGKKPETGKKPKTTN